ncbi:carbohydrate ABC transporter permease [Pseudovibrio ascidiaceicola]|jgi:glucose/mannose transport system permease protein|uniref:Glucose/mannose transport system permease protein n=1 Tax=Pseudovibrio ascidiaceicola TaxID=285279 RepID=A0A1I4FQD0_9HYPH|nr:MULTISPECIES: sugar ABC transporter permease [Pseudovibrio]KZK86609.1 Lactose transport system permease protein LacF [Pseudovibrio sp. Ad13]SFL20035.1 glucose/mannose transport system permease protein [Pseudovibrio ascidiaceicola]
MSIAKRPNPLFRNLNAKIAALPMIATTLVVFLGCSIWTVIYSFSKSRALPVNEFVGFAQYERLFRTSRWLISLENIVIYGVLSLLISFVIGFILAALIDQKIRFEDTFRTIYLYPFALSFIVTGIVWQWILNPSLGIQETVRSWGFENFTFDLIANRGTVLYALLIAGIWQGTGFVMVLMLAGIRGVDREIWNAARIDGIPVWKTYLFVIVPMMRGVMVTTLVIVAAGIVKLYDLVVAMTQGGPGIASEVPAKYVYDFMFARANVGQALAASTVMLTTVLIILIPWVYLEYGKKKAQR